MALIKCFDCGKEISDRAGVCPFCGCPIDQLIKSGETVKIKLLQMAVQATANKYLEMTRGDQKVSILSNGRSIWEGRAGQVAELSLVQPTDIEIKYHMSTWRRGGKGSGTVDPARSKTYIVSAYSGVPLKLELRPVDSLDADS